MIHRIHIFPPCPLDGCAFIPLLEPHQLPPGVPFDECLKQMKEQA